MAKLAGRTGHSATDELLKKLTKSTEKKPVKTTKKEKLEKEIDEVVVETEVKEVEEVVEPAIVEEAEVEQETAKPKQENKKTDNGGQEITFAELKLLFGIGFSECEYREMYSKYVALQNNYPLRTEMHKEALITYVKYAYKRDKAIAEDDMEAADKWGKLAAKQATDAKINPSQLSAADLSQGITCFSQLSQAVEKAVDVVPLLNEYIERPRDRVDYTIYLIFDYLRDLAGKSHIDYKDVYKFVYKQRDKNTEKWGEKVVPQDDKPAIDAILVDGED